MKKKNHTDDLLSGDNILNDRKTRSTGFVGITGGTGFFASGYTMSFNEIEGYKAEYIPPDETIKIYSREDMDKVVMMLTLYVDDPNTRAQLEDVYQSWKDSGKI